MAFDPDKHGGVLALGGLVLLGLGALWLMARRTERATQEAIVNGGTLKVRLTGFWPFVEGLSGADRLREGGPRDRVGNPLHTLEDHLRDPGAHPYVSVSGDPEAWPYGQRIIIANWPSAIFRVVDTGGHFMGDPIVSPPAGWKGTAKVYRAAGYEPLDVCVDSPETVISPHLSSATIVAGDDFAANHPRASVSEVDPTRFFGQELT